MESTGSQEIAVEILPLIRTYKDGRVERLMPTILLPPSLNGDGTGGVSSKDILISPNINGLSARLYLPTLTTTSSSKSQSDQQQKLPILVYFHGGGFFMGSPFSSLFHSFLNKLVREAKILAVSVEYRLAPEFLLPAAYDDCWNGLQWVLSHSSEQSGFDEPWLRHHGNFHRLFLGGESAGGNIVHNIAMRAGEQGLKIFGAFMVQPFFCSSTQTDSENSYPGAYEFSKQNWSLVSSDSIDDPKINPMGPNAPSLSLLGCTQVLIFIGGKDAQRDRGRLYYDALKKSGWEGEVELFEVEGEDHAFHLFKPDSEKAVMLIKRVALFLNHP